MKEAVRVSSCSDGRLTRLGPVLPRDALSARILDEHRPAHQHRAFWCGAWARDPLSEEVAEHVAATLGQAATTAATATAGVLALGMSRRRDLLQEVKGDAVRAAARWWITAGGAIRED